MARNTIISLFAICVTVTAIYLNFPVCLMGYPAPIFNLIVSIVFLALWFMFSFYWGFKREQAYRKFILWYWGINIVSSILIWLFVETHFLGSFLVPFILWYCTPIYGFRYLIDSLDQLTIVTAPLGMLSSGLGYLIGKLASKGKKNISVP